MYLTRHQTPHGPRWAVDGKFLPQSASLEFLLELPADNLTATLKSIAGDEDASGPLLAPIEQAQEFHYPDNIQLAQSLH